MFKRIKSRKASTPAGGAPTRLSEQFIAAIARLIEEGNYLNTVMSALNIRDTVFYRWLHKGREDYRSCEEKQQYSELWESGGCANCTQECKLIRAVNIALAKAETNQVRRVNLASIRNPKYAAWMLERRYPERWAHPETRARLAETRARLGDASNAAQMVIMVPEQAADVESWQKALQEQAQKAIAKQNDSPESAVIDDGDFASTELEDFDPQAL